MRPEDVFLQAILQAEARHASTARLVYADWLEERGEPARSELIRVCEAMRGLPIFSDDYWQLKARRNELRPNCPADWLAVTGYDGSRYDPLFRDGIPPDCVGRWRLIREFTERWHGIPMGDVGGQSDVVHATEQRLGRPLPASLREYVAFNHEVAARTKNGIVHRDDFTMELMHGQAALLIMVQDGHLRWAIPYAHLSQEDPPVYAYSGWDNDDTEHLPIEGTGPEVEPLSEFVLGIVDKYKPAGGSFRLWSIDAPELRRQLAASCPVQAAYHITQYLAATSLVHAVHRHQARIHEGAGILAWLSDNWHGGTDLYVHVHPSLPREAVPEFLWEYARQDSYPRGMFLTEAEPQGTPDD